MEFQLNIKIKIDASDMMDLRDRLNDRNNSWHTINDVTDAVTVCFKKKLEAIEINKLINDGDFKAPKPQFDLNVNWDEMSDRERWDAEANRYANQILSPDRFY